MHSNSTLSNRRRTWFSDSRVFHAILYSVLASIIAACSCVVAVLILKLGLPPGLARPETITLTVLLAVPNAFAFRSGRFLTSAWITLAFLAGILLSMLSIMGHSHSFAGIGLLVLVTSLFPLVNLLAIKSFERMLYGLPPTLQIFQE